MLAEVVAAEVKMTGCASVANCFFEKRIVTRGSRDLLRGAASV